jgi:hypothetical protein
MRDPLAYYFVHVQGYGSGIPSAALVWGSLWHEVTAEYKLQYARESDVDKALLATIRFALAEATKARIDWISANSTRDGDENKRTTYTLVRSLIWWVENYRNDRFRPVQFDGKLAVELNFALPLPLKAPTGENYVLCGYLDEVVQDEDGYQLVLERKTTTKTISSYYFYTYDPSVQVYTYDLVGSILLPKNPIQGVVIEATQTAVGFSRFERHDVIRTREQREHWLKVLQYWIKRAERDAIDNNWEVALNTEATTYESKFRDIERRAPTMWPVILGSDLIKRPLWNPLESRTIPQIIVGDN